MAAEQKEESDHRHSATKKRGYVVRLARNLNLNFDVNEVRNLISIGSQYCTSSPSLSQPVRTGTGSSVSRRDSTMAATREISASYSLSLQVVVVLKRNVLHSLSSPN